VNQQDEHRVLLLVLMQMIKLTAFEQLQDYASVPEELDQQPNGVVFVIINTFC